MLYGATELIKYKISGIDGSIGKIIDFYFDSSEWTIRYVVVNVNSWLPGGKVLLSASSFERFDTDNEILYVNLTKEQIKNSPSIDVDAPISRQKQDILHDYYKWPMYWAPTQNNRVYEAAPPATVYPLRDIQNVDIPEEKDSSHLRSLKEIVNYTISTTTGNLGNAQDLIIQQDSWIIKYMIMDTGILFSGKKVLMPIEWIKWVSFLQKKVAVSLTKEKIESCPSFDVEYPISQKYEEELCKHYDGNKNS